MIPAENLNSGVVDDSTPHTIQTKILEPEMIALQRCLKVCQKVFLSGLNSNILQDTVIKTGQVYSFYADTRKLCVNSLTSYIMIFFDLKSSEE